MKPEKKNWALYLSKVAEVEYAVQFLLTLSQVTKTKFLLTI